MKKAFVLCAAAVLASTGAFAEGHAEQCFDKGSLRYIECPKEETAFDGPYAGAAVGAAVTKFSGLFDAGDNPSNVQSIGEFHLDDMGDAGFAAGAYLGHVWRLGDGLVIGAEIDATFAGAKGRADAIDTAHGVTDPTHPSGRYQYTDAETEWYASARARAGYAFDGFMPYVTGGVGAVDYSFTLDDEGNGSGGGAARYEFDRVVVAPVVGGGVEWAMGGGFLLRGEGMIYLVDESDSLVDVVPDSNNEPGQSVEYEGLTTWRVGIGYEF